MPAKIPPATRGKILKLRRAGKRVGEIVAELGLGRSTVQRYVRQVDAEDEGALALEGLSAGEVGRLKILLACSVFMKCPGCSHMIAVMPGATPTYGHQQRPLTHIEVRCPWCGKILDWEPEKR